MSDQRRERNKLNKQKRFISPNHKTYNNNSHEGSKDYKE
jgi:hypothetical protein